MKRLTLLMLGLTIASFSYAQNVNIPDINLKNALGDVSTNVYSTTNYEKVTHNGKFIDARDGYEYQYVAIGDQIWMAENLRATTYIDGTSIPLVEDNANWGYEELTDTGKAYCWYNNDSILGETYGTLYTWAAAMNGEKSSNTNPSGVQGVCPDGWHLPSDEEWIQLIEYLGGEAIAGSKLKDVGTEHWDESNITATNESGFKALPGGYRIYTGFTLMGLNAAFYTATESCDMCAFNILLACDNSEVVLNGCRTGKTPGRSVRCVMNQSASEIPQTAILDIKIYPNPAEGIINIETDYFNNSTMEIYNISGVKIMSKPLQSSIERVDASDLPKGIYLIKLKQVNKVYFEKIVAR